MYTNNWASMRLALVGVKIHFRVEYNMCYGVFQLKNYEINMI